MGVAPKFRAIGALCAVLLGSCGGGGSDDSVVITELALPDSQKSALAGEWNYPEADRSLVFVVRSADEWNRVWEERKAHVTCPDPLEWSTYFCASPTPPPIDFERYSLVGMVMFGYFIFGEPNPRRVEDDGHTLLISYRYYSSGHAGTYPPNTRFFLVPRTTSALKVDAQRCSDVC